jgi:hypothetical protein
MIELFAGTVEVNYGQAYIEVDGTFNGDMAASFTGQRNGLLGAVSPEILFLVTGLHTGPVGLTVTLHETEPAIDQAAEDIVEASFMAPHGQITLIEWAADTGVPLPLPPGTYRARYSGTAMQAANDLDTNIGDTPIDRYTIDLWPAAPAPDRILKQTSPITAYWHNWAGALGDAL